MARIRVVLGVILVLLVLVALAMGCMRDTSVLVPTTQPTATVVQKGTLAVSIETAGAARSSIYTPELQGVEMLRVKLSATVEDAKVKQLVLDTVNGSGNIAKMKLLGTGLPFDPFISIPLVAGEAAFYFPPGSEIVVPAYGTRVLTTVVDTTGVGSVIAGQFVTMEVRDIFAVGAVSGATVSYETPGGMPSVLMGNPMRMEEVEPVITRHPDSPSGAQVPGIDEVVAVFQVTASGFRDLTFNSLVLEKVGSNNPDKNVRNFSLWRGPVLIAQIETEIGVVPFGFQEQIVTAGQTEVLTVKADTRGVRTGAAAGSTVTFSVKIPGTSGPFGEGGLRWDYTPLGLGTATYTTASDSYPVQGGVLEY